MHNWVWFGCFFHRKSGQKPHSLADVLFKRVVNEVLSMPLVGCRVMLMFGKYTERYKFQRAELLLQNGWCICRKYSNQQSEKYVFEKCLM